MKPSEIFEGENSGLRKAFDEAVGREQSHIDQGKAGIDENLKSMNNGMVFNPNNMTNTEKILAEFRDIFLKDESSLGLRYLMTNGAIKKFELEKIEAFITTKINQALAEERDRVREEIGGMKGLVANPDYFIRVQRELRNNQATEGLDDKVITQIVWVAKDRVLSDLLFSLDKPLINKNI